MIYRPRCIGCRLRIPHGRYIDPPNLAALARPFLAVAAFARRVATTPDTRAFAIWLTALLVALPGIGWVAPQIPPLGVALFFFTALWGHANAWYHTRDYYVTEARRAALNARIAERERAFTTRTLEENRP